MSARRLCSYPVFWRSNAVVAQKRRYIKFTVIANVFLCDILIIDRFDINSHINPVISLSISLFLTIHLSLHPLCAFSIIGL